MRKIVCCNEIPKNLKGFVAEIDGQEAKDSKSFLKIMWEKLKMPYPQWQNWDGYLDWMRDLTWIKEQDLNIIFTNFNDLLSEEPAIKASVINDFVSVIFNYWNDVKEEDLEDKNQIKNIAVYCVNQTSKTLVNTKDIVSKINKNALMGMKAPHSTSQPVLRMENGKMYLASFVFFFDRKELQSATVRRPSIWVIADLESGAIVDRYRCTEKDFSKSDYDKLYNTATDNIIKADKKYWEDTYALMDQIRNEYMNCGVLREDLYKQYLERINATTPEEYRVFYRDMNNIENKEN